MMPILFGSSVSSVAMALTVAAVARLGPQQQAPATNVPAETTLIGCVRQEAAALPGQLAFRLTDVRPPLTPTRAGQAGPSSPPEAESTARGETREATGQASGHADPYRTEYWLMPLASLSLATHVNHTVRVTGTLTTSDIPSDPPDVVDRPSGSAGPSTRPGARPGALDEPLVPTMKVQSLTMVSPNCS